MTARLRGAAAMAVAAGCALALASVAAGSRQSSTPVPGLASMALAPEDFLPGATVAEQSTSTSDGQQVYLRRFAAGARIGSLALIAVVSEVVLYNDAGASTRDFALVKKQLATKAGRNSLGKEFTQGLLTGAKGKLKVKQTVVAAPVALDSASLWLSLTVATNQGKLPLAIEFVQVDRVMGAIYLAGPFGKKLGRGTAAKVAAAAEAHMKTAFTVASSAAPTVGGQAQQGQILTVDEGSWTGAPSGFSYAWARCDATGGTCTPVDGATDKTYTPAAADSGFTIRVTVTGSNAVSSQQAVSSPTAAVP